MGLVKRVERDAIVEGSVRFGEVKGEDLKLTYGFWNLKRIIIGDDMRMVGCDFWWLFKVGRDGMNLDWFRGQMGRLLSRKGSSNFHMNALSMMVLIPELKYLNRAQIHGLIHDS